MAKEEPPLNENAPPRVFRKPVTLVEAIPDLPDPTYPITSEDDKFKLDFDAGRAGTKLSKSLISTEGGVACTYFNIDETFPSRLHVKFGAHDAQVGDKRYVHLTYAEGKTVVLPVTVTEEA